MNQKTEDELKLIFKLKPLIDDGVPEDVFYTRFCGLSCFFQPSENELGKWEWSANNSDTTMGNGIGDSLTNVMSQCHNWFVNKLPNLTGEEREKNGN